MEGAEIPTASWPAVVQVIKPSLIEQRLQALCSAIAQGFGATANVTYQRLYPATINSAAEAQFAGDVAERLVGSDKVVRYLVPRKRPSVFAFAGDSTITSGFAAIDRCNL